jgi:hypothetical protein
VNAARPAPLAALAIGAIARPFPTAALAGGLLAMVAGTLASPALMLLAPGAIFAGGALAALLVLALGVRAAPALLAGAGVALALCVAAGIPPEAGVVLALVHGGVVVALAAVLRRTGSLALALSAAGALAAVAAVGATGLASPGEQSARRAALLEWATRALGAAPPDLVAALDLVLALSGGILGLSLLAGWSAALCGARSLHARAVAPGAFAQEFRALRFGRALALAALVAAGAAALEGLGGRAWAAQLALVGAGLLSVQALAVLHALAALRLLWPGTLWLAYGGLVLVTAHALALCACIGVVDNWLDFRTRAARRAGTVS